MAKQALKTSTEENKAAVIDSREVKAHANMIHISPRKTRLVADLVRGKSVAESLVALQNLPLRPAKFVLKLLLTAVANAEHNFKLDKNNLKISKITVDQGPVIKRWRPRAYGRASAIRRPTSRISLVLEEDAKLSRDTAKKEFPIIKKRAKKEKAAEAKPSKQKPEIAEKKAAADKSAKADKGAKGSRKLFQRKGGDK